MVGFVGGSKITFFIDSGSKGAYMSRELADKLGLSYSGSVKHLLADRSVSMDLGQTPEVAVTLGDRSYKVSFSVLENPVSPAAFGIRQVKMLSGLWYWPEPTRPGYIELGDGGRIDLLPFDPVESSNVISFLNTVERHPKAFAPIDFDKPFTPIAVEPHVVQLTVQPESLPRDLPRRRLWSHQDQSVITEYFEKRLKNGMWRPVSELEAAAIPWISYPFCVPKANGARRVVFNFATTVNRFTAADPHRMPNSQDIRNSTAGAKLFSVFDMQESFSQFPLAAESQLYFATELPDGRIVVPTVVLMGPTNSPAAVQRRNEALVAEVLKSPDLSGRTNFAPPHIDDFVISTVCDEVDDAAVAAHAQDLDVFLTVAERLGYSFNSKSRLFVSSAPILGLLRKADGFVPPPDKVKPILELDYPRSLPQVRHLLGVLNEFSAFIDNYAGTAEPLFDLLTKPPRRPFHDPSVLEAVDALKRALVEAPCLQPIDPDKEMRVEVDASGRAWAAVLRQLGQDGAWHPCWFVSHLFTPAQRKYSATDRETLGVVSAAEALGKFVIRNPKCTFVNDHRAVGALSRRDPIDLTGKQARWLEKINSFGLRIEWKSGAEMVVPDALSRAWDHLPESDLPAGAVEEVRVLAASLRIDLAPGSLTVDWEAEQRKDPKLVEWIDFLAATSEEQRGWPQAALLRRRTAGYFLRNGVLCSRFQDNIQRSLGVYSEVIRVPLHLQDKVVSAAHEGYPSAHFGVNATFFKLKQAFVWDNMHASVVKVLRTCPCQLTKTWKVRPGLMVPVRAQVTRPFEMVGMDIAGPLPLTRRGHRYFLVMVDVFSGWVELAPLVDVKAATVLEVFRTQWCDRYGIPDRLVTDRGGQFIGHEALDLFRELGIDKRTTSSYHPQADGVTERFVGSVKEILRRNLCSGTDNTWDDYLSLAAFALRTMERQDRPSAAEVLFGMRLSTPFLPSPPSDVSERQERRRIVWEKLRAEILERTESNADSYNSGRRHWPFKVGALVFLRRAVAGGTLARLFDGPYRIAQALSDVSYRLTALDGSKLAFHDVVHVSRLKPCWDDPANHEVALDLEEERHGAPFPAPVGPFPAQPVDAEPPAGQPLAPAPAPPVAPVVAPAPVLPADPAPGPVDVEAIDFDDWIDPADLQSGRAVRQELARRGIYVPTKSSAADLRARYEVEYKNRRLAPLPNSSFLDKGVVWCASGGIGATKLQ